MANYIETLAKRVAVRQGRRNERVLARAVLDLLEMTTFLDARFMVIQNAVCDHATGTTRADHAAIEGRERIKATLEKLEKRRG
jgi:hypothetical protein